MSHPINPIQILIAEDDRNIRDTLTVFLEELTPHNITAVKDGQLAWKAIEIAPPDLLITDIQMPNMDGLELIRTIRQSTNHASLPIIVMSAFADGDWKLQAAELGISTFITKPFSLMAMMKQIEHAIDQLVTV